MRIFCLIVFPLLMFSQIGCVGEPNAVQYYSLEELESLDKFKGYDMHAEYGPTIEGPYRIVPGVNYTVKREAMIPLDRELDFNGKRYKFVDHESRGWGFRFLAVGNPKGESCAIMLKTEKEVPNFNDVRPKGPGAPEIRYDGGGSSTSDDDGDKDADDEQESDKD